MEMSQGVHAYWEQRRLETVYSKDGSDLKRIGRGEGHGPKQETRRKSSPCEGSEGQRQREEWVVPSCSFGDSFRWSLGCFPTREPNNSG
jgi:hypothetical protein